MRLLDRYLLRELLMPLAVCLIGIQAFVVVFTVFSDASKIQENKLHFLETIEYAVGSSMDLVWVILPISLLLALLITQTHFARHNEITAMRAAGRSLWRIFTPYFVVGLMASLALLMMNELLVPRCADWADRILHRYSQSPDGLAAQQEYHAYFNAKAHRLWQFAGYRPSTSEMTSPKLNWPLPDGSWREVSADRAVHTNGVWTFFSETTNVIEREQIRLNAPEIPILVTNVLAMPQFTETPQDINRDIRFSKYDKMKSRKLNLPLAELWGYLRAHPTDLPPSRASLYWTKFDARLAAPWTCLVVVLIAIPFGAASGRRNLFFGVAGSIFICFGFFVVQQLSLAFGSGGYLPAWLAAWLPNLLFGGMGLFLISRVR